MRNRYYFKKVIYLLFFYGTFFCLASYVSAAVNIVAFGDSITTGYPFALGEAGGCQCPEKGYEVQLQEQMYSAGYRSVEVYNYGFGGEITEEGLLRISDVFDIENPDYVLLLEGTNDLGRSIDPSTVIDNLSEMIETILNSGATPILATLTPDPNVRIVLGEEVVKDIDGTNELIWSLWEQKKVKEGKNVLFADLYAAVVDDWDNLSVDDHLHPNEEGYRKIAETWGATLQQDLINIDLATSGEGTVSCDPPEEDCTSCRVTLPPETEITLTATPAEGSIFKGWSGECADQGQTPECVLTVDENMGITAMFAKRFPWPLFLPAIISNTRR